MAGSGGWMFEPGSQGFPLVIAHRGAHSEFPENTIAAFEAALTLGADGVEMDVRLTGDGQVAVVHERRTDAGGGRRAPVGRLTLARINDARAAAGLSATVPTLQAVLDALPATFLIDVELKVRGARVDALVSRVVDAVRGSDRFETTLVTSHNPLAIRRLRKTEPRIDRGYIWGHSHPWPLRVHRFSLVPDAHWLAPSENSFDRGLLDRCHRLGRRVLAWDVDVPDPSWLAGIDAIVTDDPGRWVRLKAERTTAGDTSGPADPSTA